MPWRRTAVTSLLTPSLGDAFERFQDRRRHRQIVPEGVLLGAFAARGLHERLAVVISLKKTFRKLGLSFWDYLNDRITQANRIPFLPAIIETRAAPA
jgi:hypothetical protein